MATEVGWAGLGIVPTFDSGFDRDLSRGLDPHLARAGKSSGKRFGGIFGKAAVATAAGAVGAGFAAFKLGKDSVGAASDLNESLNAVNVTYGKQSGAVKKLGREAARSLGLSNTEFNSLSVRFSAFSKTIAGGKGKKVVTTLDDLTTRASDFASVMNLEVNEAAELFQSGLAGETEPLRKFGIDLSAAAVTSHAYAEGIAKVGDDLTESEKVQARYSLLMEQTDQAQGDFANTSGDLANQQRILSAEWDNARAKLGTALLPIMEDVVGFVLDKGIPAFESFSDWFAGDGIDAIGDFGDKVKPLAEKLLPAAADAFGVVRDLAKDALPYAEGIVDAFNDMPDWAKKALVGGVAVGAVGAKLKPDSKGGLARGVLGSLKPVPVFVTNMGGGLGGDGTGAGGKGKGGKPGKGPGFFPFLTAGAALTYGSPLLLSGDQAPGQKEAAREKLPKEVQAWITLLDTTGKDSEELAAHLSTASREQLKEYRKAIRDEFGIGLRDLSAVSGGHNIKFNTEGEGDPFLSDDVSVRGARRAERQAARLFETTFQIKPAKGQTRAEKDFQRLLGYRGDLEGRPISPEIQVLGLPAAKQDVADFQTKLDQLTLSLDKFYRESGGSPEGTPGGPTVNYNGPVTYTDDNAGRKAAQQRSRRTQLDGVRRP